MRGILALRRSTGRIDKSYGRDSLLIWMNPLFSAIETSLGLRIGLRSDAEVLDQMQKDVLTMESRGYHVVSSEEVAFPVFLVPRSRATYYRVTYERDTPGSRYARSE